MNFLRNFILDSDSRLAKRFMPHQVAWIQAEKAIHAQRKQAVALVEKSVRIGWTYADAFKNVRKRLWFKGRDYLFATKDYPSALEYVRQCYKFAEIYNLTRSVISHGEESISLNRLDDSGHPSSFTEEVKVGVIKFDNGSRIIAFSANPQAMAVYGGDVGLDEFAKHPNARLLWETAQGRVTWNYDIAVWSSHDGEDTLFNEFAQEARAALGIGQPRMTRMETKLKPSCAQFRTDELTAEAQRDLGAESAVTDSPAGQQPTPKLRPGSDGVPHCPWNIYFRVTMVDAIRFGLVQAINRARGTEISEEQFLADCRARARDEDIFQQAYMCNPRGATSNHIVAWSAIENCRTDYPIERVHLEADAVRQQFGEFNPSREHKREEKIHEWLHKNFPALFALKFQTKCPEPIRRSAVGPITRNTRIRLGFDVAASGAGDLAVFYLDHGKADQLWLRALLTARTEDWHFLKTVLFHFLEHLPSIQGAGDETGLGRQICWEAAKRHSGRFLSVNFASEKPDLGFTLMNQLSVGEKLIPRGEQDIAADYFALRKVHNGTKWIFTEGPNAYNQASHCDIAWAGALATHAHLEAHCSMGAAVAHENGWSDENGFHPYNSPGTVLGPEAAMILSDDPRIWKPWPWR